MFKKTVLAEAEQVVTKTAAERNKLHIRLIQLNGEIAYLQSEIASGNASLQDTLNERLAEKATVETELNRLNGAFLSELKSMRDDLLRERLAVLKFGKDRQESLASEIKRLKVDYLKKVMVLKEQADDTFADVSSYDEIMKFIGQNPVDVTATIVYPFPVADGEGRYQPYVTKQEIGAAYEGNLPYATRQYEINYMKSPYTR
ncbi:MULTISPECIES: hypothetical protein [Bacillus cereus group]|uniref:Uncharacterized protein n=1 Tax=Bacillus toyonensis TaxID=155322 RepID=A0ABX6GFH8_9BACI|nr:hypothetical protein [Bacillus toyonensis]MED2708613.1 hypothetical protein [Bacillus toyonensis]MED2738281.1 hypothetical protein [Bacillus toyonensis]PDZ29529.1 hypothetical protein CON85_06715 [Bacillus toyonensis]PFX56896.1 hypothetical protein COL34_09510 [Bacillus toyonensis]PHF40136.1 hypothetical protein COF85_06585 [Bacillus toyonensis]